MVLITTSFNWSFPTNQLVLGILLKKVFFGNGQYLPVHPSNLCIYMPKQS